MSCCLGAVYRPLITDCTGVTRHLELGEELRINDQIIGYRVINIDSSITIDFHNVVIIADATGGSITITLPLSLRGQRVTVKKVSASNNITITATGGQLIDGSATEVLNSPFSTVTLLGDGAAWHIV